SNTLGVVEAGPPVPWTKPADIPYDPKKKLPKLVGPFANEFHVGFMDGRAEALTWDVTDDSKAWNVTELVFRHLIERDDGHRLPDLQKFRAATPLPETDEERAAVREQIARNRKQLAEVEQLMKEHVELLGARGRQENDHEWAEWQAKRIEE